MLLCVLSLLPAPACKLHAGLKHLLSLHAFVPDLLAPHPYPQAGEHAGFKHLLSLHAFVVTDVELCMPPKDPFKFVRSLAPYLKVPAAGGQHCGQHAVCG